MNRVLLVGISKCLGRLHSPVGNIQWINLLFGLRLDIGEALAFDELHRKVVLSILLTDGEDGNDVRVMQVGDGFCLSLKSLHRFSISDAIAEKLQCNTPT